ncbi:MAG: hypothetical protein JNK56_22120, partial [Myxococcales bacterium]|nr:hypothetical protein [Myxococcales bacterium]
MGYRAIGRVLAAALVIGGLLAPGTAWAGPPWATDAPSFQSSYLQSGDLPSPSEASGDTAAAAWQVHDIRWVFP